MENETGMPLIGDKFPEIEVQTTHGRMKLPDEYSGKWFILFSHPADFTPVCTTEFVAFQKIYGNLKKQNCELIGLSVDQVFSHLKWIEWIKHNLEEEIKFPVIADTGEIARKMGLIHPNKGTNTVRAVFIVDSNAIIRAILYYPQELGRNTNEILRMVKALKIVDSQKVAMPANWPENTILGNEVIVPPAMDEETAKERVKQYKCFDWWLCHKKL